MKPDLYTKVVLTVVAVCLGRHNGDHRRLRHQAPLRLMRLGESKMRRCLLIAGVSLMMGSCSDSSTPTAPSVPAKMVGSGNLTTSLCSPVGANFTCSYSGIVVNEGIGCAKNLRGSTISYSATGLQVGLSQWDYPSSIVVPIRPGERVVYTGFFLTVPSGNFTYNTQPNWTDAPC